MRSILVHEELDISHQFISSRTPNTPQILVTTLSLLEIVRAVKCGSACVFVTAQTLEVFGFGTVLYRNGKLILESKLPYFKD